MVIALKTTRFPLNFQPNGLEHRSRQFLRHALADGPHSTSTVRWASRSHIPPIVGDAFGPVLEARRWRVAGARAWRTDGGVGDPMIVRVPASDSVVAQSP
jgi:hypothetical protein